MVVMQRRCEWFSLGLVLCESLRTKREHATLPLMPNAAHLLTRHTHRRRGAPPVMFLDKLELERVRVGRPE